MSNAKAKNKKNMVIAVAMIAILAIASIAAYFTATDTNTNTFTIGNVTIDQTEPAWDETDSDNDGVPDQAENVVPNQELLKNPKVKNTGKNDAYVFTVVAVPKKVVKVAKTADGIGSAATNSNPAVDQAPQMTQLFQLNGVANGAGSVSASMLNSAKAGKTSVGVTADTAKNRTADMATKNTAGDSIPVVGSNNANAWTGTDSWGSDWYLLDVNDETIGATSPLRPYLNDYNIYLFAYGSADGMTKLAGSEDGNGAETSSVFNSVTFANVINVNDVLTHESTTNDEDNIDYDSKLEGTMPQILVKSFAIQSDNIQSNGADPAQTVAPAAVWSVLNNQDGAYRAVADELHDLDAANSAWKDAPVDTDDKTIN